MLCGGHQKWPSVSLYECWYKDTDDPKAAATTSPGFPEAFWATRARSFYVFRRFGRLLRLLERLQCIFGDEYTMYSGGSDGVCVFWGVCEAFWATRVRSSNFRFSGPQFSDVHIFPKRLTSRGFRNQKEGGAGFWPISPGSVSEGGAAGVIPIDVTPIQRCTSVKYTFGWSILGCTPPPRGSPRYTKKLQAVTCVPSQNICSTLCSALFFRQRHNHDSFFWRLFQRCPPKRFPNCFISLHFSPPKSHAPQRYSEIYILAWTQLPHFESHVT